MSDDWVLYDLVDGVAVLTLNNRAKHNALSRAVLAQFQERLDRIRDDPAARVVVVRSEGPVFCSGHDLREMVDGAEEEYAAIFAECTLVMEAVRLLPQAGHCPSAGSGHRRRLPAGGDLRPGSRGRTPRLSPPPACRSGCSAPPPAWPWPAP